MSNMRPTVFEGPLNLLFYCHTSLLFQYAHIYLLQGQFRRPACGLYLENIFALVWFFVFFCFFLFVNQVSREPLNGFAPNHKEDVRAPSLERVWMSRSKIKGRGHQGQKRAMHSRHPRQRRNGTISMLITLHTTRQDHSVAAAGWFRRVACGLLVKPVKFYLVNVFHFKNVQGESIQTLKTSTRSTFEKNSEIIILFCQSMKLNNNIGLFITDF